MLIKDNAGCEQSALGRALSINRSSAMKLVNALSDKGLIERADRARSAQQRAAP